ncbi:restriction endonuclease [Exiguobacterium flavidum]|uniref:restriction endonuclease n=1 Tax=Exiguobacterium flavidum TaxID=2184695 RepID=UPI000DF763B6|nr:hypothetical protein [Exiguobacterium flavidum]
MNVWIIRPLPHGANHMQDFLEEGIIAVGYPVGERLDVLSYDEIRESLKRKGWQEGLGNVNILVHLMQEGDLVIVPDANKKDVYFGKITSGYRYEKDLDRDVAGLGYPHQRKVDWYFGKKPLLRGELPEVLKGSLRYPGTVADISKHKEVVRRLVEQETGVDPGFADLRDRALETVRELLESPDDSVRLKAAEIILNETRL